jgi:type I restriction enzyme, S subunit
LKSNKLGLLTTKIGSGVTPRGGSSVYQDSGTHLIRSQNIHNHKFEKKGLVCISQVIAEKMKSVEIMKGDVLINITGDSVARAYLVPDEVLPARVNQHVCILRTKPELNQHYLYYFLISQVTQNHLLSIAGIGGTRNALTKDMLFNLFIEYPDHPTQEKIVKPLNTIKNKILVLENQNKILEQIVQSIFKSWFIDFDGISEFEDSELGQIPKDSTIKNLGDVVNVKGRIGWRGYASKDLRDEGPLVIGGKHITNKHKLNLLNSVCISWEKFYESPEIQIKSGDIIVTKNGNSAGRIALIDRDIGSATINPNVVLLKHCSFQNYMFYYMTASYGQNYLISAASSGSAIPTISNQILKQMKIIIPNKIIVEKFEIVTGRFRMLMSINQEQINFLGHIRDTLLPKLMSGEIKV